MGIVQNLGRWIAAAGIFAILSACGPVIETHYDYLPPSQQGGMQCLSQCQQGQNQCRRSAEEEKAECRYREDERIEYEYDQAREKYYFDLELFAASPEKFAKPTAPTRGNPSYYRCDNQQNQCQANFNMCYRSCGGQVNERQVCVANCEE
jgi:hypothetical protein